MNAILCFAVLLMTLAVPPPDPGVGDPAVLVKFKAAFAATDDFVVTDRGDNFEITVTHESKEGATGGAEQYILNKETGEWRMGWHEHPMPMPTLIPDKGGRVE